MLRDMMPAFELYQPDTIENALDLAKRLEDKYWFMAGGVRYHKRVHHWLMEPIGGDVSAHDHEFDDVEWMEIGEAKARATYDNERKMIAEADRILRARP